MSYKKWKEMRWIMEKELLRELEDTQYQLDQYRMLTQALIRQNITKCNIDKFLEEEVITTIDGKFIDYDYDLYNWLKPDFFKNISNKLISLETKLKKQQEIIDKMKLIMVEELPLYDNEGEEHSTLEGKDIECGRIWRLWR